MSSSSSSYFSFVKPIAGGIVGTPLKVSIKNPPRHDDDGSVVTPMGSYVKVEQESRDALADEQKKVCGGPKAVSTSPVVKLASGQMLARRGTRVKRFNDKIKDCIFNSSLRMPRMNFRVKDRQIYHFSRLRRIDSALVSSTTVDVAAEFEFKLSDVASPSEFTALFDQYRIAGIEFWIFPEYVMNTTVNTDPGTLISVIDLDDITAPSPVFDTLAQYQTAMISTGLEGHYRNFVPGILMDAQSTTGFLPKPAPWIDAAYDGLNHYGIKVGVTVTSAAQTYHAVTRYHFEFRKVR